MNERMLADYQRIRGGDAGFYEQQRGLIAVWGREAVQFLNGMVTNDVAKLEDGAQMLAAFPNAQGRLIALVRVRRAGDRFLFETEEATREKVFQNLFRFTFAGDFFVEDLSEKYRFFRISDFGFRISEGEFQDSPSIEFESRFGRDVFVPADEAGDFLDRLKNENAVEISDELYEVLRVEKGIPVYGAEWDETTIVPELGLDDLISYNKGCYIGQEIIARIYFRGHVAKQMRGLILSEPPAVAGGLSPDSQNAPLQNAELKTTDDKNAGRITSVAYSPQLAQTIALGFVRYDYLADGTELKIGELTAIVKDLPFIE